MARPLVEVEIGNGKPNTIPDTGSHRLYIRAELVEKFLVAPVERFKVRLCGEHSII